MLPNEPQHGGGTAAAEGMVTGDMLAQHAYCPRRLHLMYAEGRWADNEHTDAGRWVHRNADRQEDLLPALADPDAPRVVRSVTLECLELGLRAKLDLLELDGDQSVPVEIKRGHGPQQGGTYPPERVQLGAQAVLLRAHGHPCEYGFIYYAETRSRVRVDIDEALRAEVVEGIAAVKRVLALTLSPPPLVDSPKCPGCSVVGICLPDETNLLTARAAGVPTEDEPLRRFVPPRDDARPLYVQEQGAQVGKRGETLTVTLRGASLADVRLLDVSQLVVHGGVSVTAAALHLLCEAGIPVIHMTIGHWFIGMTSGPSLRNAFDRAAQFARSAEPAFCLRLAKSFVIAKGRNQRTLLVRNGYSEEPARDKLRQAIDAVDEAHSLETLLGAEGRIAALYFGAFASMIRPRDGDAELTGFDFNGRNRRPPRDPVNAMLSFGYAMLTKDATVALLAAGLDPYWGVYHQPRHGRPSLALDLMEEFRALIVDSAVITAINTGVVDSSCFETTPHGCALTAKGRKAFLRTYEVRMDQLITHPVFEYRVSWRRVLAVQAQLLARVFRGAITDYPAITTR